MGCCQNPSCVGRAAWLRRNLPAMIEKGDAELAAYVDISPFVRSLRAKEHLCLRREEREFDCWKEVQETIFDGGYVIQRDVLPNGQIKLLIMGWLSDGKEGRPFHIPVLFDPRTPHRWEVLTIYDPSEKPHMWDQNFTVRVCWCRE